MKFDSSGKFIALIGRVGQGPGEFIFPLKLSIDEKDNLFVRDIGMIIAYDKEGRFARNIQFAFPSDVLMNDFCVIGKEVVFALTSEIGPQGKTRFCVVVDPKGRTEKRLDSYRDRDFVVGRSSKGGYGGALKRHNYSKNSFLRGFPNSAVCYGTTDEIVFPIYNMEGKVIGGFRRPDEPRPLTRLEKRSIQKGNPIGASPPDIKPLFASFFVDEKGRFYILRKREIIESAAVFDVEIFSSEGWFIGKGDPLPEVPRCLRNGAFYIATADEEDRQIIRKYTIEGLENPET